MSVSQRGGQLGGGQPAVEHIVHLHERDYVDGLVHLADRRARGTRRCWATS
jgi:hypothetical protein